MSKKCSALVLTLLLLWGSSFAEALNRSDYAIASGNVAAVTFADILSPFSGTLLSFDWETGDRVSEGETLFCLRTQTLYAPVSGKITAVFAQAGADASGVLAQYGALAALEAQNSYLIQASTAGAYNKSKNRELHIGEKLWFKSTLEGHEEGSGQVIQVSGENYTVEIQEGSFDTREKLNLFRSDDYSASSKVGAGTVVRRDPLLITGSGRIQSILIQEGQTVEADAPLFELISGDSEPGAGNEIVCPGDGVLSLVAVQPGQQVWKGALLARVSLTEQYEVIADVDEMDLSRLRVGDSCPVTLDLDESKVLQGRITEIGALGFTRQNAAWFRVHLSLDSSEPLPLGASASVYLPK